MSKMIIDLTSESAVSTNPFLAADGLLNFVAVSKLQDKVAAAIAAASKTDAPLKVTGTFVIKRRAKPVPYSAAKTKSGDHKYLAARATKVVLRKRVTPESLARVAVLLQVVDNAKLNASLKQAQSAMLRHSKKCESVLGKVTKEKGKLREASNAVFEKSVAMLREKLSDLKPTDIVEAMGMMGKTVIVRLGADNYVSIGKADKARFAAAVKASKAAAAAK